MEYVAVFEEQVTLTPKDLRKEITSIDAILEQKLRVRLEGRCSRNGYVIPDGLHILSRSMGTIERGRFTGNLLFHVQAEGKVLNPPDGTIVTGEVIRKNKMGLYVEYAKAIRIIIPRDINIGNKEFETVEVGEMVDVEIKKSRFQVNDEYILSVGLFKGISNRSTRNVYDANKDDESESSDAGEQDGDAVGDAIAALDENEDYEGDDGTAAADAEAEDDADFAADADTDTGADAEADFAGTRNVVSATPVTGLKNKK